MLRSAHRLGHVLPQHRLARQALAALDVALDHHVVRPADEKQMLHVVPPQQDELPLPVELVHVDDAEPRLAAALPGPHGAVAASTQAPDDEHAGCQHAEDHEEDDEELEDEGTVRAEERRQGRRLSLPGRDPHTTREETLPRPSRAGRSSLRLR
ncbi:MAG: hypothetical protein COT28_03345 [Methylobacterium sp. CG08_land_8_20_14_0_20_71_15]|nr:MAG: hypothetical protein COT28_03345 [Methylobacterium sp. CG08_land_8_20_14_0_20_71_15]